MLDSKSQPNTMHNNLYETLPQESKDCTKEPLCKVLNKPKKAKSTDGVSRGFKESSLRGQDFSQSYSSHSCQQERVPLFVVMKALLLILLSVFSIY